MLTSKEAEVIISAHNIKRLQGLGYQIPMKIGAKGYEVAIKGEKIKIKVEHLTCGENTIVEVKCDYCGETFPKRYSEYLKNNCNLTQKDCCNQCKNIKQSEVMTTSIDKILLNFDSYGFKIINGIEEYKNNKSIFLLQCRKNNTHFWKTSVENFNKYKSCPDCNNRSHVHIYEEVKSVFNSEKYQLLIKKEDYQNSCQLLNYICPDGHKDTIRFQDFLNGTRCPTCKGVKPYTYGQVYDIFKSVGCLLISKTYKNNTQLLDYVCSCGNKSKICLSNFLNGSRCKKCGILSGENHPNWNPNKTHEQRVKERKIGKEQVWRNKVFERDNYICQCCGDNKGGNLQAHHKDSYDWCDEKRFDTNNGATLCEDCHKKFHSIYGYGRNTQEQFDEFYEAFSIGEKELYKLKLLNKNKIKTLNNRQIYCVETGILYNAVVYAAKDLGVERASIRATINQSNRTSKGFHFVDKNNYEDEYWLNNFKNKILIYNN